MRYRDAFPKVEPGFEQLARVLRRERPDRVPAIELFSDHEFIAAVLGYSWDTVEPDKNLADWQRYWLWRIEYQRIALPDFLTVGLHDLVFPRRDLPHATDTAALSRGERHWHTQTGGTITTRAQFDAYDWPAEPFTNERLDFIAENAPPGMGTIPTSSGVLEWAMWLMGYEALSMALYDEPALVRDVVDRIGERFVAGYEHAANHPAARAIWLGDDLGFKTATMISPEHLRQYVFPWHKRIAAIAHERRMPFLLHACGNLSAVIDDLIDDVGIDGWHSFEDVILPVTEAKRRYGRRVAILGGVDVDFMARQSPGAIRRRTRETLDACAADGGYALGTGNSVANYIPLENYIAMHAELAAWNAAHSR
jgi:uroporphyrinogen decarboxylase